MNRFSQFILSPPKVPSVRYTQSSDRPYALRLQGERIAVRHRLWQNRIAGASHREWDRRQTLRAYRRTFQFPARGCDSFSARIAQSTFASSRPPRLTKLSRQLFRQVVHSKINHVSMACSCILSRPKTSRSFPSSNQSTFISGYSFRQSSTALGSGATPCRHGLPSMFVGSK